jgi:Flp pilus assembly protein TadD
MSSKGLGSALRDESSMRSIVLAAASIVICGLAGCATAPVEPSAALPPAENLIEVTSAEDARKQAEEARAKGNSELALRLYVEAADRDPTDAESLYQIGALYEERKDLTLAARAYSRAVQIDPVHARALAALGLCYFETRQFESAAEMLSRAVAADPTQWRGHNALGLIDDTRGSHESAAMHYAAALAIRPDSAAVLNNRGYSSYLAGNLEAAERDFRASLAVDPEYDRAWQNLGLVFARQGRYETALAMLGRVQSRHVAANDVGYIAMVSGDYAAAETLFSDAIRLSPRYYETANENVAELKRRRAEAGRNPQ